MPPNNTPLSAALPGTWELLSRTDVDDAGEPVTRTLTWKRVGQRKHAAKEARK